MVSKSLDMMLFVPGSPPITFLAARLLLSSLGVGFRSVLTLPLFVPAVVAKSLGFSWGAAGLSTALFTGVFLADVLDYVQPVNEGKIGEPGFRRAEHVIFEGAEDLPNGKYGTSQRLRWARMKEKGMMLAWAMNGEVSFPTFRRALSL